MDENRAITNLHAASGYLIRTLHYRVQISVCTQHCSVPITYQDAAYNVYLLVRQLLCTTKVQ